MSFQFQIEELTTPFRGLETTSEICEKQKRCAPLILLDQWRCDVQIPADDCSTVSNASFYFDFSERRSDSDEVKGRYYERLSETLPVHSKVRREIAVRIFRFLFGHHPLIKYESIYFPHSRSRQLDFQELAFYECVSERVDDSINFIFEKSLISGLLLFLVYAWNHGYIYRFLNIEGGIVFPLN